MGALQQRARQALTRRLLTERRPALARVVDDLGDQDGKPAPGSWNAFNSYIG